MSKSTVDILAALVPGKTEPSSQDDICSMTSPSENPQSRAPKAWSALLEDILREKKSPVLTPQS